MKLANSIAAIHARVGYRAVLLLFVLFALLIGLFDVATSAGVSRAAALSLLTSEIGSAEFRAKSLALFAWLAIVVPLLAAMVQIRFRPLQGIWSKGGIPVFTWYIVACAVAALMHHYLQICSEMGGYRWLEGHVSAALPSLYLSLVDALLGGIASLVVALLAIILTFYSNDLFSREFSKAWEDYRDRALMADTSYSIRPIAGPRNNFSAGAFAPQTPRLRAYTTKREISYQKRVPGSTRAAKWLNRKWQQVRHELLALISSSHHPATVRDIAMFSSTSRAMEVALLSYPGPRNLVISPYEHPSTRHVARWIGSFVQEDEYVQGFAGDIPNPLEAGTKDFVDRVATVLVSALDRSRFNVVVLSEVHYITGTVLPVEQIQAEVINRSVKVGRAVGFVIDGAHAIGNHTYKPAGLAIDAPYVFSGHKWLGAAEPSGLLTWRTNHTHPIAQKGRPSCYDMWSDHMPRCTVGSGPLLNLRDAVRLHMRMGEKFHERREVLYERLLEVAAESSCELLRPNGERSNLVALHPAPGRKWVCDRRELEKRLRGFECACSVMKLKAGHIVLRLMLQYYLDLSSLDALGRALRSLSRPA